MAERKPIPKKTRFEVFKRDKFTCQYCGRMAPDVVLEIDHIKPISKGGTNNILNLITSCFDCNRGKGKTKLSDDTELKKQQEQIKILADRKEQIEFLSKYRMELLNLNKKQIDELCDYWTSLTDYKFSLNESGRQDIKRLLRQFTINEIYDGMDIAIKQYYNGGKKSVENAFSKIGGICYNRRKNNGDL